MLGANLYTRKRSSSLLLFLCAFSLVYVLLLVFTPDHTSSSLQVVYRLGLQARQNLVVESLSVKDGVRDDCAGRRLYLYELPSPLNQGLLQKCNKKLVNWLDFCPHTTNFGFGQPVDWSGEQQASNCSSGWHGTDAYMLEVIFHSRARSYRCLTNDSSKADAVFVPYYGGLDALQYLYRDYRKPAEKQHGEELVRFLGKADAWRRWNGRDHFMILGRTSWDFIVPASAGSWGTGILGLPHIANMTTLFIERNPWAQNQVAVPYPTGFHPRDAAQLQEWIDKVNCSRRKYLFTFSGGIRSTMGKTIRGELLKQCAESSPGRCARVDCGKLKCGHDPRPTVEKFLQSQFCLQPRGDTPTRRSAFDALVAGCIPVFFHSDSAYTQYVWHLPANRSSYSVFIDEESVRTGGLRVEDVLASYSRQQVHEMRKTIVSIIPRLLYSMPSLKSSSNSSVRDAFDVSLDGVFQRVAGFKRMEV